MSHHTAGLGKPQSAQRSFTASRTHPPDLPADHADHADTSHPPTSQPPRHQDTKAAHPPNFEPQRTQSPPIQPPRKDAMKWSLSWSVVTKTVRQNGRRSWIACRRQVAFDPDQASVPNGLLAGRARGTSVLPRILLIMMDICVICGQFGGRVALRLCAFATLRWRVGFVISSVPSVSSWFLARVGGNPKSEIGKACASVPLWFSEWLGCYSTRPPTRNSRAASVTAPILAANEDFFSMSSSEMRWTSRRSRLA